MYPALHSKCHSDAQCAAKGVHLKLLKAELLEWLRLPARGVNSFMALAGILQRIGGSCSWSHSRSHSRQVTWTAAAQTGLAAKQNKCK